MKIIKLTNKGVTLVELLIYLGLSIVMLVVLSELFIGILNESVETQNYSATQTDGRYIMGRLRGAISNASLVSVPANLGDASDHLELVVDGVTQRYYISNDKLYLNDGTGDYLISHLDSSITGVSFTRTGNAGGKPVIDIEFTSSTGVSETAQYESQTFKGAGGLR